MFLLTRRKDFFLAVIEGYNGGRAALAAHVSVGIKFGAGNRAVKDVHFVRFFMVKLFKVYISIFVTWVFDSNIIPNEIVDWLFY